MLLSDSGKEWLSEPEKRAEVDGFLDNTRVISESEDASLLGHMALMAEIDNKPETAEALYKRAIEADPNHANSLGNYASFLADVRKNHNAAEVFYKRSIEAAPTDSTHLGNYGQFLIGRSRSGEGVDLLRRAWEILKDRVSMEGAEVAFALWLGSAMAEREEAWEGVFKFIIAKGFVRYFWNFDAMLEQAEKGLSSEDVSYAKALAAAFLDASKVPELDKLPHWRDVVPLDPALVNPDGTVGKK
jgi:tetratricopeptide (TPR) repeat protein